MKQRWNDTDRGTTNPIFTALGANPGLISEMPGTNCLSYGTNFVPAGNWTVGQWTGNFEVIPQAVWRLAKFLTKGDWPGATIAVHGLLGVKYQLIEKLTSLLIAWRISAHSMTCEMKSLKFGWDKCSRCARNRRKNLPETKIQKCTKMIKVVKPRKTCSADSIANSCFKNLPRRTLIHVTHLLRHSFRLSHFQRSGMT
jgi:hypothetical protein